MPIGSANWIAEGMLGGLENTFSSGHATGFHFTLTNQIFHGTHPLGWIRGFSVDIDGHKLPSEAVTFVIRDQAIPSALLPEISDIWWQPRETAIIRVKFDGGLPPGRHLLGCDFQLATIIFTPSIDRQNIYRTMPGRLEANLQLVMPAERRSA